MFSKSKIFEEFLDFLKFSQYTPSNSNMDQIEEKDVLSKVIRRLKESGIYKESDKVGQFYVGQCLYTQNKDLYIQSSKAYIEDKIVNSTLYQLTIIVSAFIDVGVTIQSYNYKLDTKVEIVSDKLKAKGYDDKFLLDAISEFHNSDNRACVTSLAAVFEHVLRVRLINLKSAVTSKTMIGQLLNDPNIGKVMRQDEIDIVRDIANTRNAKGAHGSIVYDKLNDIEMENMLKTGLNVLDDIKL